MGPGPSLTWAIGDGVVSKTVVFETEELSILSAREEVCVLPPLTLTIIRNKAGASRTITFGSGGISSGKSLRWVEQQSWAQVNQPLRGHLSVAH
jgi:hypothetical protein